MDAGIVGAGIMGRLLAFKLLHAGWQVTLFDQNPQTSNDAVMNCSMAAAGLLTPISELDKADAVIAELGLAAIQQHWHSVLQPLAVPIYFQQNGSLAIAHPRDAAELSHFISRIKSQTSSNQTILPADMLQLEPELTKFQQGYYFPQEGHIDSQGVFQALGKALQAHAVTWHFSTHVNHVLPGEIHYDDGVKKFDWVFDCRGLGAKSSFPDLRGVRGELIWLHADAVNISRPIRFLHPRYSLYIIPRSNHIYLVGASEIESEDLSPITINTALELLTAAYYIHPGFAQAHVIKTVTQCRPTLSHHLPQINAKKGLIAINGLYRHGYLIAPTLAEEVLQWLLHGKKAVSYPTLWRLS